MAWSRYKHEFQACGCRYDNQPRACVRTRTGILRSIRVNPMLAARDFFSTAPAGLTPQMERDFFASLMTRNKTYKTTFHQRFVDADPLLLQQLKQDGLQAPDILDVGVSSGVSTVELHDVLEKGGLDARIVATDLLVEALLVHVLPGCHALLDPSGFPLRFDLPSGTMKPWVTRDDYRNGFFILRKAINAAMTRLSKRILHNPGDARITKVRLVTPRLATNSSIAVVHDDIGRYAREFARKFDLVRAANVLNKGYFAPDVLSTMLANIGRYLRGPGATMFVVRTHEDNSNHGTLFRVGDDARFTVVWRIGTGSEIEDVVLQSTVSAQ